MKVFGDSDYKGYLYSKKNDSKHYITAVDRDHGSIDRKSVNIWFADKNGNSILKYKIGSDKNIDYACKTWLRERYKQHRRVDYDLFDLFNNFKGEK